MFEPFLGQSGDAVQRAVVRAGESLLDRRQRVSLRLEALDSQNLEEMTWTVERRSPLHLERSIHQSEGCVVPDRPHIRDFPDPTRILTEGRIFQRQADEFSEIMNPIPVRHAGILHCNMSVSTSGLEVCCVAEPELQGRCPASGVEYWDWQLPAGAGDARMKVAR